MAVLVHVMIFDMRVKDGFKRTNHSVVLSEYLCKNSVLTPAGTVKKFT